MTRRVYPLTLAFALALTSAAASAQAPTRPIVSIPLGAPVLAVQAGTIPSATVGPVLRSSAVGVRPSRQNVPLAQTGALVPADDRTQSRAMMIVGGAALIVGALIGGSPGTIVMVGGAVVGLFGLYNYFQ
ncbi:MAG: hypothetical protein WBQ26_12545 [Gemmatimonadaceae bacterium]